MLSLSPMLLRQAAFHPAVLGVFAFTALWLALKLAGVDYLGLIVALGWTVAGVTWLISQRYVALADRQQQRYIRAAHAAMLADQITVQMPLMRCPAGCAGCEREREQEMLAAAVRHGHIPADRVSCPGRPAAA